MLKTKRMFVTLLISAMFLIGGAFTALAAAPDGSFDAFEGNTIVGWAWDSSMPNTGVPVNVTITNKETGEQVKSYHQTAVTYRSDLKENGIGNGNHGFRISINWDALADGTYYAMPEGCSATGDAVNGYRLGKDHQRRNAGDRSLSGG